MRLSTLDLVAARIDEQNTGILVVALQLNEDVVERRTEGDRAPASAHNDEQVVFVYYLREPLQVIASIGLEE